MISSVVADGMLSGTGAFPLSVSFQLYLVLSSRKNLPLMSFLLSVSDLLYLLRGVQLL